MKQYSLALTVAASLLFYACESTTTDRNTETTATAEAPDADNTPSAGDGLTGLADAAKKLDALKALKPLGDGEMKKLLPAELAGLKRGDVTTNETLGKAVDAEYKQQNGGAFSVYITDCVGELGAGKYLMSYATPLAAEDSKPATEETKTLTTQKRVPFAGQQAITHHDPVNDVYNVVFLNKERLLVDITGTAGVSLADVLAFATAFNAQL